MGERHSQHDHEDAHRSRQCDGDSHVRRGRGSATWLPDEHANRTGVRSAPTRSSRCSSLRAHSIRVLATFENEAVPPTPGVRSICTGSCAFAQPISLSLRASATPVKCADAPLLWDLARGAARSPVEDYADEAGEFRRVLQVAPPARTTLLGSGAVGAQCIPPQAGVPMDDAVGPERGDAPVSRRINRSASTSAVTCARSTSADVRAVSCTTRSTT